MKNKTIDQIKKMFTDKGYRFFEKGDLNLNIFSVRSKDRKSNKFDDMLYTVFKVSGEWKIISWPVTTDPGLYYRENPANVEGVAILAPGQYSGSHQIGLHRGKYEALVQRKPVAVYRDNDYDNVLDMDERTLDIGIFGINIHKAGKNSTQVDNWSAGCTVFAKESDFDSFMSLAKQASIAYGNSFTYTLFHD